jgi:hypothetical protein
VRLRRADRREQLNVWLAEDHTPDRQQTDPAQGRPFLLVILGPDAERNGSGPAPEVIRISVQPQK